MSSVEEKNTNIYHGIFQEVLDANTSQLDAQYRNTCRAKSPVRPPLNKKKIVSRPPGALKKIQSGGRNFFLLFLFILLLTRIYRKFKGGGGGYGKNSSSRAVDRKQLFI